LSISRRARQALRLRRGQRWNPTAACADHQPCPVRTAGSWVRFTNVVARTAPSWEPVWSAGGSATTDSARTTLVRRPYKHGS